MRRDEPATLPKYNAWEVKLRPSFVQNTTNAQKESEINQGPYMVMEIPSEAAAEKVKARAVAGFHSDGRHYLLSEIIDRQYIPDYQADLPYNAKHLNRSLFWLALFDERFQW